LIQAGLECVGCDQLGEGHGGRPGQERIRGMINRSMGYAVSVC
jgi:hypothetical protein